MTNNKEEILDECLSNNELGSYYQEFVPKKYQSIFKAMDEYAKQVAIEFAEWIGKEDLKLYAEGWCQPGGSNGMHLSTSELYSLWEQTKNRAGTETTPDG